MKKNLPLKDTVALLLDATTLPQLEEYRIHLTRADIGTSVVLTEVFNYKFRMLCQIPPKEN